MKNKTNTQNPKGKLENTQQIKTIESGTGKRIRFERTEYGVWISKQFSDLDTGEVSTYTVLLLETELDELKQWLREVEDDN